MAQGALLLLDLLAAALAIFTGPRDLDRYPRAESSLYRLPWPAGVAWSCVQGNRGIVSHRDWEEFAYDFKMPVGSDVCAARAGVVKRVDVGHDGHGLSAPNNLIQVDHGDGTSGWYLHLRRDGALVRTGDRVRQGQRIALSGHVGKSLLPHLHFQVTGGGHVTISITFADVTRDRGIPRMGSTYTSGNLAPPSASDRRSP